MGWRERRSSEDISKKKLPWQGVSEQASEELWLSLGTYQSGDSQVLFLSSS